MGISRSIFNGLNQEPPLAKKYVYVSYVVGTSNVFIAKYTSDGEFVGVGPTQSITQYGPVIFEESTNYDNYLYGRKRAASNYIIKVDRTTLTATYSIVPTTTGANNRTTILDTGRDNLYIINDTNTRFMRKSDMTMLPQSFSAINSGIKRFPKMMYKSGNNDVFAVGNAQTSTATYTVFIYTSDNSTTITQNYVDSSSPRSCGAIVYDRFNNLLVYSRKSLDTGGQPYVTHVRNSTLGLVKTLTQYSQPTPFSTDNGDYAVGMGRTFQTSNGDIIYTSPYPDFTSTKKPIIYRKTWDNFYADSPEIVYSIPYTNQFTNMALDDRDHLYVNDGTSLKKYDDYGNIIWQVTLPGSIYSIVLAET